MSCPRIVLAAAAAACVLARALVADAQAGGMAPAGQSPLLLRDIAPPSADFTTYLEGELIRVSVPSNWRELPGPNAVTFAPDGAVQRH